MDLINEVLTFSRDYVNGNQTQERKRKIAAVYKSLFGENLKIGCGTCYVEAIFKIKDKMNKVPCSFRLKPGALLRSFSDESKTCTNANLTDELAEFHLRNNPGCIRLFSVPTESEIQRMFFTPQVELEIIPPVTISYDEIDKVELGAEVKKTRTRKPKK